MVSLKINKKINFGEYYHCLFGENYHQDCDNYIIHFDDKRCYENQNKSQLWDLT